MTKILSAVGGIWVNKFEWKQHIMQCLEAKINKKSLEIIMPRAWFMMNCRGGRIDVAYYHM